MEYERIRRLLHAEYTELLNDIINDEEDELLVESPFAETTRDGRGIREVALGLTRTKLIIAVDVLPERHNYYCPKWTDSSIETLELASVYPLELVMLSVFRRRHRQSLKARLVDGRVRYYELGGLNQRDTRWSLWRSHVRKLLDHRQLGSSFSETTAAISSSSATSISRIPSLSYYDSASGRCWRHRRTKSTKRCRGGAGGDGTCSGWTTKDLYLGAEYAELYNGSYVPRPLEFTEASLQEIKDELEDNTPAILRSKNRQSKDSKHRHRKSSSNDLCDMLFTRKSDRRCTNQHHKDLHELLDFQPDECRSSGRCSSIVLDIVDAESDILTSSQNYLSTSTMKSKAEKSSIKMETTTIKFAHKLSRFGFGVEENCCSNLCLGSYKRYPSAGLPVDPRELIESAVVAWETARQDPSEPKVLKKHLRRYGISPSTYFLYACGPWSVQPGDRESIQIRRSHSCVTVRRQPVDSELRLPVSRRQLAASVSLTDLNDSNGVLQASTRATVVLFWTPDYWYRPRAAIDAYKEVRRHLGGLWLFRMEKEWKERPRKEVVRKKERQRNGGQNTDSNSDRILNRLFSAHTSQHHSQPEPPSESHPPTGTGTTALLRRLLKLDFQVTLWDLDSSTLAQQMTLIDRELFLRIPGREIATLARHRTSRDSPNLGAWVAFAHRVSCLVASEVMAVIKVEMRARLIARLVNTAEKCFEMGNFQSARSIVAGLQSPAVYRLRETWAHMKIRHATCYDTLEKLCRVFKSTRTRRYREAWALAETQAPPLMPFVGDVIARTLGLLDDDDNRQNDNKKQLQSSRTRVKQKLDRQRKRFRSLSNEGPINSILPDRIAKVADWLERCQRHTRAYDFPGHSLAWEFLLKARYYEDRDNFFASLQLEPPCYL